MTKSFNTLLIDDHPFIIDAYENYLKSYEVFHPKINFNISSATNADDAVEFVRQATEPIHFVFLDIRIPESKNGKYKSGEDVGLYLMKKFPYARIIVITGHYDALLLSGILQNINPEGLLYKSDVDSDTVSKALNSILNNVPFYSATILKLLRKKIGSKIILDRIDKLLLYELSKGTKTKDLTKSVPLSIGGIEKRKRNLKELFEVSINDDQELIKRAVLKGFL